MTTECCWHFDLKLYCVPWSQEKMKEIEKLTINQAKYKYKDDHGKEYDFWKGVLTHYLILTHFSSPSLA